MSLVDRYVAPRFQKLLHGNVVGLRGEERAEFARAMAADARSITDHELGLLFDSDWRDQITAAWLAGLSHRTQYRDRIGEKLLASEVTYAGQGFCLALARFSTRDDAWRLVAYLSHYLPQSACRYDQTWALGALMHLDARLDTREAQRFIGAGGLWKRWAAALPPQQQDPEHHHMFFNDVYSFSEECVP
ncbi:DUF6000 family protein [Kibdelosporangium aridum]|uniref:DUF6000 family protein n=1 Tax=Kibdelosporangium aridum TaxID=2030 RepID=UPI000561B7D4|nr:DUF6000 family protein [Kibdelosporangium aridum]